MYQFSRSIYRELSGCVEPMGGARGCVGRQRLLETCEAAMERLALDRHYFARPARTLFRDVRHLFPLKEQMRVYHTIEQYVALATEYVEIQAREGIAADGSPLCCNASTRKGTPCQRMPLPGSRYCPSHKHLEEDFGAAAA
jgi:hypothetical protein